MDHLTAKRWLTLLGLLLPLVTGCAAFRPIHGVPARYMPDEFKGPSRSGKRTIDLSLLRQRPPAAHIVDSGDLLSIYIEGILGRREEQPPVYFPQNNDTTPTVGYPLPVRDDGTLSLPLVGAIPVRGMTLTQVEDAIRKAYTVDHQFLQPGRDRLFVALQRPRHYRVLVIRQEAGNDLNTGASGQLNLGMLKRGTGKAVSLPVYKNDVLNALAETGGLPGLDAENAIYIIRNGARPESPAVSAPPAAPQPAVMPMPSSGRYGVPTIRGQSPAGSADPRANYRAGGGVVTAGFTQPAGRAAPIQQLQYLPPYQPQSPGSPPALMPPGPQPQLQPTFAPRADEYVPVHSLAASPMTTAPAMTAPTPQWQPMPDPLMSSPSGDWTPMGTGWTLSAGNDTLDGRHVVRIPIRLGSGEAVNLSEQDVILHDGDIVFIESRETEVFYTGGLLGGGQFTLPRDYDLDVLGAIAVAQGQGGGSGAGGSRATQSAGGQSALNNDVSISASQVIILRPLCDGTQLTIQVDLYEALRNPNERIIIQPGDYILLQYTRPEAILAFIERHLLEGALFGLAAAQLQTGN
uniref:Polysaccharide export protein N-terminal domain-containing protein n=1 Tax=Schlesneria paludicola TaxID=360056 RepID=A0A7C2NYD8_9PLAN